MNEQPPTAGTQNAAILAHLRAGHRITGLQALREFGVIHLPRRILDLKERGYPVADRWVHVGDGKRVKEYRLDRRTA